MLRESYDRAQSTANTIATPTSPIDQHQIRELAEAIATLAAALKDDLARIERRLDRLEVDARKS